MDDHLKETVCSLLYKLNDIFLLWHLWRHSLLFFFSSQDLFKMQTKLLTTTTVSLKSSFSPHLSSYLRTARSHRCPCCPPLRRRCSRTRSYRLRWRPAEPPCTGLRAPAAPRRSRWISPSLRTTSSRGSCWIPQRSCCRTWSGRCTREPGPWGRPGAGGRPGRRCSTGVAPSAGGGCGGARWTAWCCWWREDEEV